MSERIRRIRLWLASLFVPSDCCIVRGRLVTSWDFVKDGDPANGWNPAYTLAVAECDMRAGDVVALKTRGEVTLPVRRFPDE